MEMKLETVSQGVLMAHLEGQLNMDGVNQIGDRLVMAACASGTRILVADLSKVPNLSSMGIRLLYSCAQNLKTCGGKLYLMRPTRFVHEVLDLSGVSRVLPVVDDVEQAERLLVEEANEEGH